MNQQMILAGLRITIQAACSSLVTRGVMTSADAASALQQADVVLPAVIGLTIFVYQLWQKRLANQVAATANLPDVKQIVTTRDLATAVPSAKVVPGGG